jgi:hypothetical protein
MKFELSRARQLIDLLKKKPDVKNAKNFSKTFFYVNWGHFIL